MLSKRFESVRTGTKPVTPFVKLWRAHSTTRFASAPLFETNSLRRHMLPPRWVSELVESHSVRCQYSCWISSSACVNIDLIDADCGLDTFPKEDIYGVHAQKLTAPALSCTKNLLIVPSTFSWNRATHISPVIQGLKWRNRVGWLYGFVEDVTRSCRTRNEWIRAHRLEVNRGFS